MARAGLIAGVDAQLSVTLQIDASELAAAVEYRHALDGARDQHHVSAAAQLDGAEGLDRNYLCRDGRCRRKEREGEKRQGRAHAISSE